MTTKLKPFDKGFFAINNAVFDVLMPDLSPAGFKVLCVAVRATLGWHKESDILSYSQFSKRSGIKSRNSISAALQECLDKGYLKRTQTGTCSTGKPVYCYSLNLDFELVLEDSMNSILASNENILSHSNETILLHSNETIQTKQQETTIKHVDADSLLSSLLDQGVDKAQARKLIKAGLTHELLDAWLDYIDTHNNLQNPVGFLVSRLKLAEYPPQETGKDDQDSSRYLCKGSEFDGLILS